MSQEVAPIHLLPASAPALPQPHVGWGDAPTLVPPRRPLDRPIAAIRRYKWLMLGVLLVAIAGGIVATRMVNPEYEVRATVLLASETALEESRPTRSNGLLGAQAWVELIKSYRISDAVVRKLALYVKPDNAGDSVVFRGFDIGDRFVPGTYTLDVDRNGRDWNLALEQAAFTERGVAGDSVGRQLGLRWAPPAAALARYAGKKVKFTVATPRETSVALQQRLGAHLNERSAFLNLSLTDPNPQLAARTLNTWVAEYVKVAEELKKKNTAEFATILQGQLGFAQSSLKSAESALQNFRVATITLPQENGPVAPGVEATQDPALKSFFDKKVDYDNVRGDREALERVLANAAGGGTPYESALLIPSVASSPGAQSLRQSFTELYEKQSKLNALRQTYTDSFPVVRDLAREVQTIKTRTIPSQANALLSQMRTREADLSGRIRGQSGELQAIPTRTIEEMRLRRNVDVAAGLYTQLRNQAAQAQLAEASLTPDVSVLDSAVAPLAPTKNTAPRILMFAGLGGLAAALGLALLLDTMDRRILYPEQAASELGLTVAATVPKLPKGGLTGQSAEQVSQLVESFRTLRMNVMSSGQERVALAISSPSPGDGKSFISSNLAMSFADAGYSTLLVDGDTRRGSLHEMFGLPRSAGLTDFLAGDVDQASIIHQTSHSQLSVIPSGNPRRLSPELLTSPGLTRLVNDLRSRYDVVIFDTPPLAAGIDGYAIAAATGSLLVVLRIGQTERRMAAAKLLLVDRLPINVLGAVLNAAPSNGEYEYYGYVSGYGTTELEPGRQVAQIS